MAQAFAHKCEQRRSDDARDRYGNEGNQRVGRVERSLAKERDARETKLNGHARGEEAETLAFKRQIVRKQPAQAADFVPAGGQNPAGDGKAKYRDRAQIGMQRRSGYGEHALMQCEGLGRNMRRDGQRQGEAGVEGGSSDLGHDLRFILKYLPLLL